MNRAVMTLAVAVALAGGLIACGQLAEPELPAAELRNDETAATDDFHLDLPMLQPTTWVRRFLPEKASAGYNLVLYRRRMPMLVDMNGNIVHTWPTVRASGRIRLNRDGRLIVIGTDNLVKEFDWEGHLTWSYRLPGENDFPHHDVIQLENQNYLVIGRDGVTHADFLHEVDAEGEIVWVWNAIDHRQAFRNWEPKSKDPSHLNSISELPPNRWFDDGDERFRPGNILVSARTLNTIFIIDKENGKVVWQYTGDLDFQHEASLIGQDEPRAGGILLFNNGFHDRNGYRRSIVQVVNPISETVEWQYSSEYFFSSISGTVQALPGGNFLVCSSQGGRTFEVSPDGVVVWEWVPPFFPMRTHRLPYDHCPQLAALATPRPTEVLQTDEQPFVDLDLYKVGLTNDTELRKVGRRERRVMKWKNGCRAIVIPPDAVLKVGFGLDKAGLEGRALTARFRLTLGSEDPPRVLIDQIMETSAQRLWSQNTFPLDDLAYQKVDLCIATDARGDMARPEDLTLWSAPLILSSTQRPALIPTTEEVTEQEERLRRQQLEALGYVN